MKKPPYEEGLFPHWTTIDVRFRDLDTLKHVNNAIFSTYYEEARISFIQVVPRLSEAIAGAFSFVLADISICFIKPATFPSRLLIGSGIKELGNTSITSFQGIYDEKHKELISVAEATGVWFNLEKQRPSRLPDFDESTKEKYMLSL